MASSDLAVLRIDLLDVAPPVWRRIALRTTTTLEALHRVVQAAMDWRHQHLWRFDIAGESYGLPDILGADGVRSALHVPLARVIGRGVTTFAYLYDFGDSWLHGVTVEGIETAQPGRRYPDLLACAGRCPPEDCGGPFGYEGFLADIARPEGDPRRKEALDWLDPLDESFDPDDPDEAQLRINLSRLARVYRPRVKTTE